MKHLTTTPPATEPVTLADMRLHLGITQATDTARDSIITARIVAARERVEDITNCAVMSQTLTYYADRFPFDSKKSYSIKLISPVASITEIRYLDVNGIEQVLDPADYRLSRVNAEVSPAFAMCWPVARKQEESVKIKYVAGFANAAAVPQSMKEAIMFIVAQWEVFQSSIEGNLRPFTIPNAAKELLNYYIDYRDIPKCTFAVIS